MYLNRRRKSFGQMQGQMLLEMFPQKGTEFVNVNIIATVKDKSIRVLTKKIESVNIIDNCTIQIFFPQSIPILKQCFKIYFLFGSMFIIGYEGFLNVSAQNNLTTSASFFCDKYTVAPQLNTTESTGFLQIKISLYRGKIHSR